MSGERRDNATTARRFVFGGLLAAAAFLGLPGPAGAQEDDEPEQTIRGRVFNESAQDGERTRQPIADVRVVASTEGGELVAEATSDAEGSYVVALPEGGTYVVSIDESSLPEGVAVDEDANAFTKTVATGGTQTQAFFLGEDLRDIRGKWSLLPQTIANGLKLAMIIAITSIGLSLIFGTTGLSNFGHGEMVTFGAVIAWGLNREVGWHLIPAALLAIAASAVLGAALDRGLWRPLRSHKVSLTSMMIVSIGLALAARHVFLFFYGGTSEAYGQYTLQRNPVAVGPVAYPPRTLWVMGLSLAVIVGVAIFLLRTRFGKAIRAVSDNPELASSSGIDSDRVILIVWALGGALAGLGGVFYGLEFGVQWDMGFTLLLLMFAAITLGGLGNPFGALVGALVVGVFVELWTWIVPNANDLKNVGALFTLIVILLIRPQGLLGSKERIG
ncbi:MAG: branched-chain amino acid ABC transporter permease [Actinomycetota bacterium]|nr:branched-chain amino acid ABC transporter permease [Acidimicrobiia bacterium]MDQ3470653.1 branched-chain amino acid ABC transporter permease [Actinomycetota bacterium]